MSQRAPDREALPAATMLPAGFDRVVRTTALVLAIGTIAILAGTEFFDTRVPFSRTTLWAFAVPTAAVHLWAAASPWTTVASTLRGQRRFEAYPLLVLLILAPVPAFIAGSPLIVIQMLIVAGLGALASRRPAVIACTVLPTASILVSLIRSTAPDVTVGMTFLFVVPLVTWGAGVIGRMHRDILGTEVAAREEADRHGEALAAIVGAARKVQHLEPSKVLQAVADVTIEIGWEKCGLYVPAPDGVGYVLGGHCGIPDEIVAQKQPAVGVFGEVLRSESTVVFTDYGHHPDANPRYTELSTAVGAPIFVNGVQRGALVVGCTATQAVSPSDVGILEILADQAGRALEIAEQYERQQATVVELERVNQLKQDFLATVSHELRTPLAVVLGMAETMTQRWDLLTDPIRRDMTSRLHLNAAGLENVIEALLDFSRLEQGIVQPRRQDVALVGVVERVIDRVQQLAAMHTITLDTSGEPELGESWCDPLLLERVIENLLTNASRHTPAGTSITVTMRHQDEATVVEVSDDGPGIAPDDLHRIGERFYRGGDPLTRSTRGLGLGLAFCSEVLVLHESRLEIESEVGEGATFRFALPRGRSRERQPAA